MLVQSKVETATTTMTATSAAMGIAATTGPATMIMSSRKMPGGERGEAGAPAAAEVDHRLSDHGAAGHPAEKAGRDVGDALPSGLAVAVGVLVGDVVHELRRQQRLEQSDDRERERDRRARS